MIVSVGAVEHVITFHRELIDETSCHIGTNVAVQAGHVVADRVSVEGRMDGEFALRLNDLTKLDFGGGYEQSLWRMTRSPRRSEK